MDLSTVLTQLEFGKLVGISQPAVSMLLNRGILAPNSDGYTWLLQYCLNLREQAAGRLADEGIDLPTERALLAREQRKSVEIKNAVLMREYAPIESLESGLADCCAKIASQLDTIPGAIKRVCPDIAHDALNVVQSVVNSVRAEIADLEITFFDDDDSD